MCEWYNRSEVGGSVEAGQGEAITTDVAEMAKHRNEARPRTPEKPLIVMMSVKFSSLRLPAQNSKTVSTTSTLKALGPQKLDKPFYLHLIYHHITSITYHNQIISTRSTMPGKMPAYFSYKYAHTSRTTGIRLEDGRGLRLVASEGEWDLLHSHEGMQCFLFFVL